MSTRDALTLVREGMEMQAYEILACLVPLVLFVGLMILSERLKRAARRKRARDHEAQKSWQKEILGRSSDDATPPYYF